MQIINKYSTTHFMHLFYDGIILLFCVLGLVMLVALGAYGLEILSSTL